MAVMLAPLKSLIQSSPDNLGWFVREAGELNNIRGLALGLLLLLLLSFQIVVMGGR